MNDITNPSASPQGQSSSGVTIFAMPSDSPTGIITAAWRMTKRHYELILGIAVFLLVVGVAMQMVPFVRYLLPLPMTMLTAGSMYVFRQLVEGKPAKFSDIFKAFQDSRWMTALLPLAIAGVAITLVQAGLTKAMETGGMLSFLVTLFNLVLSLAWGILIVFSLPLIIFKNKAFAETIDINLRALKINWKPILIWWVCMFGVLMLSMIAFFLPFIFVGLPITMVSGYLAYAVNFEGLDVRVLAERLKGTL